MPALWGWRIRSSDGNMEMKEIGVFDAPPEILDKMPVFLAKERLRRSHLKGMTGGEAA